MSIPFGFGERPAHACQTELTFAAHSGTLRRCPFEDGLEGRSQTIESKLIVSLESCTPLLEDAKVDKGPELSSNTIFWWSLRDTILLRKHPQC